jgi:DNA ligase 1
MKKLFEVANIIKEVSETSSKKDKENILRSHKNNQLLRSILNHVFNPYIKTNIAKKKLSKKVEDGIGIALNSIEEYMSYLQQSSGRDEQIATVQHYISNQPKELHWLLESMATKTLKIGATATTINKAFDENFIPKFDVMLAEKYIETKKVKGEHKVYEHWKRYIGERVIVTKKLDGNRCVVFVNNDGTVNLFSREGHELEGFVEIEDAFKQFPKGNVYDGEILAINEEGLNSKELFQKTSKIVKKKGIKTGVEFHAFDMLPIKNFKQGGYNIRCEVRKNNLEDIVKSENHPLIKYVEPLYIGEFDKNIIDELSEKAKENEEEGIMVQLANAPYLCKRTFDILKVKVFESADILCVNVYEGKQGKNIGKLGGIVCNFKGHLVNIGSGFSDEQRELLWKEPNLIIGKIVEITYFEEFEDEEGNLDLRFPIFKTIRTDKEEPSYH